jgi:hypothetical protein
MSILYSHKQFLLSLLCFSLCASADESSALKPLVEYQWINSSVGQLRFELQILDDREQPIYAQIEVATLDGNSIQTIPEEIWLIDPYFEFIDLNDDGYTDMLFYNTRSGFGAGPTTGADVYLYIPKLKKFAKSVTLSEQGDITKLKQKGCVNVNYKSGMAGYTDEEWCFNIKTGRWKKIKTSSGEPTAE